MLSLPAKLVDLHDSQFVSKEEKFRSSVFKALSHPGYFTACMGAHFPVVELYNAIRFSNVPGIIPHGPTGLIVSVNTRQGWKC